MNMFPGFIGSMMLKTLHETNRCPVGLELG